MKISSSDFQNGAFLDAKFTQLGEDISPQFEISDLPKEARSVVLVCQDPDAPDPKAPKMVFTHWVACNLPATSPLVLPAGCDIRALFPQAVLGLNDRGSLGYIGPKPPIGTHRYFFKAFAITSQALHFASSPTLQEVFKAIDGKVLASAEIMGRFCINP